MAQFDVYRLSHSGGWVVDCQADVHDRFDSRLVIPLVPAEAAPPRSGRLHPLLAIGDTQFVLATHLATAVRLCELGQPVASLADRRLAIIGAVDVLVTGI